MNNACPTIAYDHSLPQGNHLQSIQRSTPTLPNYRDLYHSTLNIIPQNEETPQQSIAFITYIESNLLIPEQQAKHEEPLNDWKLRIKTTDIIQRSEGKSMEMNRLAAIGRFKDKVLQEMNHENIDVLKWVNRKPFDLEKYLLESRNNTTTNIQLDPAQNKFRIAKPEKVNKRKFYVLPELISNTNIPEQLTVGLPRKIKQKKFIIESKQLDLKSQQKMEQLKSLKLTERRGSRKKQQTKWKTYRLLR